MLDPGHHNATTCLRPVRIWRLAAPALIAVIAVLAATACGSDASNETEAQLAAGIVVASERVFGLNDLTAAGFKSSKTYDVTELPQAVSAHYGFWGLDPYKRDAYEVRFYPGHEAAVRFGQALAVERVGPDAKLTEDSATWKVGVRDARECHARKARRSTLRAARKRSTTTT